MQTRQTGDMHAFKKKELTSAIPERVKCEHDNRYQVVVELVQRVKVVIPLLQGVTVPFTCRVFHQSLFLHFDFLLNPTVIQAVVGATDSTCKKV